MIYFIASSVFLAVVLILVGALLLVEAKVVKKGDVSIVINNDQENPVTSSQGTTLLSALAEKKIFLPSACGGSGACGMCRCEVVAGGRNVLPTELAHLSRKEIKEKVRLACQIKVKEDLKIRIPEQIFSIKKYPASVVSNESVATFIKELALKLEPGNELKFDAGAYIQIDIPEYERSYADILIAERFKQAWDRFNLWGLRARSDEPVFRAYSMASAPDEKVLRFTVRIATPPPGSSDIPPGVGSSYVFTLKPQDPVVISGPYGEFFIKDTGREMCFVGGGAGMAPLRSQIIDQLRRVNTRRKMSFWYGARSKGEIFYEEEFLALEKEFDNFRFYIALSDPQPEDKWQGMTGFIHQCLYDNYLKAHPDPTEIEYYLCGPPMMIGAIEKMLDDQGVEPEMIAFDKF
ncbi:MAG: NADH:ubiquinone reductase (Na(+)-transporting) subunit F [Desulfobacterales bacterium]|nr:NADH:ubiquinone reductase (Na(+)-transporting) subunit F [Desulfobacterales bacterium]